MAAIKTLINIVSVRQGIHFLSPGSSVPALTDPETTTRGLFINTRGKFSLVVAQCSTKSSAL